MEQLTLEAMTYARIEIIKNIDDFERTKSILSEELYNDFIERIIESFGIFVKAVQDGTKNKEIDSSYVMLCMKSYLNVDML